MATEGSPNRKLACFLDEEHYDRRTKRLKRQAKAVPWLDGWEFDAVGRALVSAAATTAAAEDPSCRVPENSASSSLLAPIPQLSLEEALERVAVWQSHDPKLPHALESSAALARILWRHETANSNTTASELRLAYGCAVLRAINGLADVLQQQRAVAASVASLCSQLGIPSWLVDMRHQATHNQLPTLPVLRLAATTLLEYYRQVYWEPIAQARQADWSKANELLQAYKTAAASAAQAVVVAESPQQDTAKNMTKDDSKDTSSSDDDSSFYLNEAPVDDIWGSSVGTGCNRFAALQDASKPSKKKNQTPEKKTTPRKKKKTKQPQGPTPALCARNFVKSGLPVDVVYSVALTFLVWGTSSSSNTTEATTLGRGVLIPGSPTTFPETILGIHKVRQRYQPLVLALAREWPGFLRLLLVHLVDFVLAIEGAMTHVDAGSTRKLFYLDSWIRYVLSCLFLVQLDPSFKDCNNSNSSGKATDSDRPAPWAVLQRLEFPLNSLCDRCCPSSDDASDRTKTSRGLAVLFAEILGDARVRNHGVHLDMDESSNDAKQPASIVTLPPEPEKGVSNGLSLAEMETMLAGSGDGKPETTVTPSEPESAPLQRPAWVPCTSWDPCAIGTLPGYPT